MIGNQQREAVEHRSAMQALQTATKNAADYFGKLDSKGMVEKGKLARLGVAADAGEINGESHPIEQRRPFHFAAGFA